VLVFSFLTGAAAAQHWTWATTFALLCAFCGFQAEHPLVLQLKQRRSLKPRFLVWGGLYGGIALAIALYLWWRSGNIASPLPWIYLGAIAALLVDTVSVLQRGHKSMINEVITFAAVCLSAPLAYVATAGTISTLALGLWVLNSLFFSSSIFTVKLRKPSQAEQPLSRVAQGIVFHAIATLIIASLYGLGILPLVTALAFVVVLLKFGLILWQQDWYRTTVIHHVAQLETASALLFLVITALSVLPTHLPITY
jgi:hypothetical protein